ncbi:myosin-2 heavy chain-like [Aedes albopictus]|uniref:CCHC-type domain-containing protein n=1 Tax=Aedes albopictus TaxID=7160 RepID=A0ABM1XZ56_AEDAL
MDMQTMYASMDVSHLSVDEVEYELLIRNILFHFDEHESIKRRKLKDKLKSEKETKSFAFSQPWRNLDEELVTISSKLKVIGGLLENPKTDARQRQKLKTRLVHYRVRNYILSKAKGADKFRNEIVKVGRQATELFGRFFPEVNEAGAHSEDSERLETDLNNVLEEVRSEIEVLNETTASGKEIEEELEQAAATSQVLELKKKEMNDSLKRAEDILKVLSEYEEGKKENPMELIAVFKTFVRQTTEQQRQMREKQIVEEERKMKEAKDSMERKKRLEKVLISLNDRLKKEPDGSDEKSPMKSIEQEKPKVQLEDRKQGEKMISFKHDSDDCGQDISDESREKSKHRKERKSVKKGNSSSKRGKKKRHRKPSYSSTSSTTSVTESSEFSSSGSSSGSGTDTDSEHRRKGRGRRESRRNRELKRMPVAEWRLKYDGKDQGRKLSEFLKEIKMRCISEDISEKELFRSAIHLFSGRAKDWFIEGVENKDFRNWHELKRELKREFLPPDLDFQLEVQATERRQARGEKFTDYLHDMMKIFHSMTRPISDRRKFDIIWRNLRFDYKNAMTGAGVRSLSKLKKYGRIIDENFWSMFHKSHDNMTRGRNAQVNEVSASDPSKSKAFPQNSSTATRVFTRSKPRNEPTEKTKPLSETKNVGEKKGEKPADPMEGSSKGTLIAMAENYRRPPFGVCYNCRLSGHHYADCPKPKGKFCRICGFADVITPACPVCQKNEADSA